MRIDATPVRPPAPRAPAPRGAPPAADFAELLGAATLLEQPSGERRDFARSQSAFGFGVFGLFPPGREAAVQADGETQPHRAAGVTGTDPLQAPGPATLWDDAPPAGPAPRGGVSSAGSSGARIAGSDALVRDACAAARDLLPVAAQAEAPGAAGGEDSALERAPAAAQARRATPPHRPPLSTLVVVEQDGELAIVAAAAGLDPADQDLARSRLRAAAARQGVTIEDIRINGRSGPPPAAGGDRHGHRAR